MKSHIVFHTLAELELNDAIEHYERENAGLGTALLREVEKTNDSILQHPEAGALIRGGIRRRLVARYPYAVVYRVKPDHIRVLAIMNLWRRPFYWVDRM